jgi:hypothetical protein
MPTLAPHHQYLRNNIPDEYHPLWDFDTEGRRVFPGEYDDDAGLTDLSHEQREIPEPRDPPAPAPQPKVVATHAVPDGYYTIIFGDGRANRTLRVNTQADDDSFAPGKQIVGFLSGSDNENDYTGFAFIAARKDGSPYTAVWSRFKDNADLGDALRVLVGDPRAAAIAYGLLSGKCSRCHRTLTVQSSIEAGIGPVCAQKAGW